MGFQPRLDGKMGAKYPVTKRLVILNIFQSLFHFHTIINGNFRNKTPKLYASPMPVKQSTMSQKYLLYIVLKHTYHPRLMISNV